MHLIAVVSYTFTKFSVWMQKPNATSHLEGQKIF